jgi:hypothetical protein
VADGTISNLFLTFIFIFPNEAAKNGKFAASFGKMK